MHILYHIPYGVIGGAETHIQYLVKYLPPGFRASISCEHQATVAFAESVCPGYVYYTPSANTLLNVMTRHKVDVFQFYHSPTAYTAIKKNGNRPKAVEVVHNRHHFNGDGSSYPKDLLDAVVGVSPDAADYIMLACPRLTAHVIPNGIDQGMFYPVPKDRGKQLVGGFTGRLETDGGKGIRDILEVAQRLPGVRFELVGLDYGGHFQKMVSDLKMTNVFLYPHTGTPQDFYHRWDFFISMSPSEGFGLSIAEALSCGLPSVIKRCGGVCHYIEDGKHALLVGSVADAVASIRKIASGEVTLSPTELDLSAKTMARRYADLYEELAGKKPAEKKEGRNQREAATASTHVYKRGVRTGKVLGISPESWHGIRRSMTSLCDQWCRPEDAITTMKAMKPTVVVFGSYRPSLDPIKQAAEVMGAKTVLTWHGTHLFNEFSEGDRRLMAHVIQMAHDGKFDFVATPHQGTAETWTHFGVETDYLPNLVLEEIGYQSRVAGINIGIMGTGFPWKNMETQILGAAMAGMGARIHVQAMHADMVLKELGVRYEVIPTRWGQSHLKLIGGMTVNLSVGITESFGYYALESLMCGVPAVTSPMVSFMNEAPSELRPLVVKEIDNPIVIARAIQYAVETPSICKLCVSFATEINEKNKKIVQSVKQKWLQE